MSDVAKTPREELECEKKYLYEHSMFWECNDGSKCQILEDDVVRLLNEQQATIQSLQTELELVSGAKLFSRRELERKVKEQQATIRKLQDLCGKSDYENAKLRIENKKLKAKLKEKEEDEQLYANEIVKLNKEAKEVLDFKSLGGDY
jgi:septal ring factor EnvC (AmiA/AmiB activator)